MKILTSCNTSEQRFGIITTKLVYYLGLNTYSIDLLEIIANPENYPTHGGTHGYKQRINASMLT